MSFYTRIKNTQEVTTTDDTPADLYRFDVSLETYFYDTYGVDEPISNWQKWNVEIIAHTSIDGYAGECATWNYQLTCRWLNEATEIVDVLPLTPINHAHVTPEADDWTVEFSDFGNDVVVTVTGEDSKNIIWRIYTDQIVVSDQDNPYTPPSIPDPEPEPDPDPPFEE